MIILGRFDHILAMAEALLTDSQDLIHKAVGWMLRELGKIDITVLENLLETHAINMPRTMLRYAIERSKPDRRKFF
jgi:3-methyladenine DNA glycosylase AlkD